MSHDDHTDGHVLSVKSKDLQRDTFFFICQLRKAQLFMGVNQKFTPVSSATIHRWTKFIGGPKSDLYAEEFFLCPVTVRSAGIMAYSVEPCGPAIEPDSTELLAPGNYGWYFNRECTAKGAPRMIGWARQRCFTFETLVTAECERRGCEPYAVPQAEMSVVVPRDESRCRFTDSERDTIVAWIVPPQASWEAMDIISVGSDSDEAPFFVAANAITMQSELRFHFHNNHFTVDVDDDYRILVLRAMGDTQKLLPTHLPPHPRKDASVDDFFRVHCRHTLNLMLLGGDIKEVYPNSVIADAMDELGVAHVGSYDDDPEMAPLDDERWQTELGQAILAHVMQNRLNESRYDSSEDEQDVAEPMESSSLPPASDDDSPDEDLCQWEKLTESTRLPYCDGWSDSNWDGVRLEVPWPTGPDDFEQEY
ncbi:hypothetical protein B0H15DRAFT_934242 [Mycena belliarum]|uniref:Uncharacterized protein n=1 Tax=Mycena belliarum TaxID=1033014 RepID=A0AAD6XKI9_9AGAR|nr:hypothetical protein B0H15DRAFT_934242 [Mycena belliae]